MGGMVEDRRLSDRTTEELLAELVARDVLTTEYDIQYKYDWSIPPHHSVTVPSEPVTVERLVTKWTWEGQAMIPSAISGYPIILPEHRHAFHQEHPNWHKAWLDSIHESLKPDDVVIDVGAEQGDLSALVASWVPDGGVVLVEPVAGFWPTIRETFEANGLRPSVCAVGFASDQDSVNASIDRSQWPPEAFLPPNDDPGFQHLNERADLPRITVDSLVDRLMPELYRPLPVDALIIDVEGAEFHVLKGAERIVTDNRPSVWCAIHPEIMRDRYGHDPNELLAFMYRLGYRWDLLAFAGEIHLKFSQR